jgi:hypothetical protein
MNPLSNSTGSEAQNLPANQKIVHRLTMKVPGTKLLADYYFATRPELDNFISLNEVKVFTIKMGFMKDGSHKQLPINF